MEKILTLVSVGITIIYALVLTIWVAIKNKEN